MPNAVKYVGKLGESFVVYYCTDEWSAFGYLDGEKIVAMERELCQRADIVFATAKTLLERKKEFNPETHLASHGVDLAHFAKALDPKATSRPRSRPQGPGLRLHRADPGLGRPRAIAYIAEKKPDWNFVVIGRAIATSAT